MVLWENLKDERLIAHGVQLFPCVLSHHEETEQQSCTHSGCLHLFQWKDEENDGPPSPLFFFDGGSLQSV